MAWQKKQVALRRLAEGLVKAGTLQFGTFALPDGTDTSYYINLRPLPSYPGTFRTVVDSLVNLVKEKAPKIDAICTVSLTGLAISSPIALSLNKPLVFLKPARPRSGGKIEGEMRPDWRFLLVDDLVKSGKTMLAAAEAVREEGGKVEHAVVLLDRLEGGREMLRKNGIALHAVTDMLELSDTLFAMELIDEDSFKRITKTIGAPLKSTKKRKGRASSRP
jgi:orotate phosphoribosyltransferase